MHHKARQEKSHAGDGQPDCLGDNDDGEDDEFDDGGDDHDDGDDDDDDHDYGGC